MGQSVYPAAKRYPNRYNNLYDSLCATARRFPDKTGLIDADTTRTYLRFQTEVDILAGALKRRCGLRHGDAVGILMENSISFLRAFYAIVKLGCTAVPLNTKQQSGELIRCLNETNTGVLLAQDRWREKAAACREECGLTHVLIDAGEAQGDIARILATEERDDSPADQDPATAAIMFTSGTTGAAKGACIGHSNILQTAYSYEEVQGLHSDDVTVLCVPVFHILGLSCVSALMIYLGATLVLQPRFVAEDALDAIRKVKATHFHSAPTVYIRLAQALVENKVGRLDTLRVCVCGGAPIPDADRDLFCRYAPNASFRVAYGMTETAGGGTLARGHKEAPAPCPGVSAMVVDDAMQPVALGQCGQVLLRGDVVIDGYLGGRGADSFHNGWLCTGDLGMMREDGSITLLGRLKELINRGGEKIFPFEVEKAILQVPGVAEAAVIGIPDPVYGEVPAAAVVPKSGVAVTPEQVRGFLLEKLAKYEIPVAIAVLDELPQTASGKTAKSILASRMEEYWKTGKTTNIKRQ